MESEPLSASKYIWLTPSEIRVANLIRQGKSTKEIAQLLDSTDRAIKYHCRGIRVKLGLVYKKMNLAACLLSHNTSFNLSLIINQQHSGPVAGGRGRHMQN